MEKVEMLGSVLKDYSYMWTNVTIEHLTTSRRIRFMIFLGKQI